MALNDLTHYRIICRNARLYGNRMAWYEAGTGRSVSFAEFRRMTDSLAAALRALGVGRGDRIGVLGKNSLEFFLLYGAAAALGAVMLPVNWRLSAGEVAFNLNDGTPAIVFADPEFEETIAQIRDKLSTVRHFHSLAEPGTMLAAFPRLPAESPDFTAEDIPADSDFFIIHTAAVAGRPRGAMLSHANLVFSNLEFIRAMSLQADDVHLNVLPLFHVGGLCITMSCFHAGAACLNLAKFDAGAAVGLIAEKKATVMFDFAPILGALLDHGTKEGADISSLKKVIGLDSPDTIVRYQNTTGGTFYSFFGQTETSCLTTVSRYDDRPGSAGRPVPAAEVDLVDDDGRPVGEGETGEIVVRGPMVFKGYINLEADTAHAFRRGWHHTGDLGRFDGDGFLHYKGRKAEKELIKPGGENVYPAEVENTILLHPAIAATVVIGVPDPKWKEGIKAVCQLLPGHSLSARELIDFVGERIARYKKPQYVQYVDELPRLADGSPDRRKVKELYGEGG
ncbi:MAG: AMP-binding protein [Desulfobulbaceae bacterium]|nr:MAG: AMP-binding protein [Desulfobulbaceae bacterium]